MRLASLLALAMAQIAPITVARAQADSAVVEFNHATGLAQLLVYTNGHVDRTELGKNPTVRLKRSIPVFVKVVNTNTAIYTFAKESEVAPSPELASLRGFAGAKLTPYLPELRAGLGRVTSGLKGAGAAAPTAEAISASRLALASALGPVETHLSRLDEAMFGSDGVQDVNTRSLLALEEMRRGKPAEQAAARVRQAVGVKTPCEPLTPLRLASTEKLLSSLTELVPSAQELRAAMGGPLFESDAPWRALYDSAKTMDRKAQQALLDFDQLVDNAYRAERLASIVASACSYWSAGEVPVTRGGGRIVTIRVEARGEPETARLADRGSDVYMVEVQPSSFIRPAIGIGAVAVPQGRYPTYGTRPIIGGFQIYESGSKDSRFAPAGSLGFTWPKLDMRDSRGMAFWLPEILVTAGGVRGMGVGGGFSWNFVKLGVGALWLHHEALDGQHPGDPVGDETDLRMTERYGPPKLYLSLTVFDWAPFASKLPQ